MKERALLRGQIAKTVVIGFSCTHYCLLRISCSDVFTTLPEQLQKNLDGDRAKKRSQQICYQQETLQDDSQIILMDMISVQRAK